ncbi:hypothetical protein DY000_02046384 [Brassica cretica]|uniref:Uncharacterized protein n=1 Tax=Brassica cretica TaxID=69181 RepID=A0ABQ7EP88_BRACR|nr:hypothetical protein DY000_02046384 [Brassica cretica]
MVASQGILRQCHQESPLANGQVLIDGQLGSQLKTIDEDDGYSEWQWDCHIPSIRRDVYIMKEFQDWLKVELREVRRDKRRQGDAEDEQACSSIKRCQHNVRVMDLDQTGGPNRWIFVSPLGQVLIQRRRDHNRDLQAQAEPLGGGSFHGVSCRDRGLYTHDRESNDLVNPIEGVFRYFIVDVVDPGSTPDIARCGRELGEQFLSHEQG